MYTDALALFTALDSGWFPVALAVAVSAGGVVGLGLGLLRIFLFRTSDTGAGYDPE